MNTTKILRHINAIRCLRLLQDGRSLSRADIARELGLTRATIGNAVNALDEAGYVVEGEIAPAEGRKGRPGVAVSLNATGAYFIGVDIGPQVLTAVLVDLRMNVVCRLVEPTGPRYRDADNILECLLTLARRLVTEAGLSNDRIMGICVSVPGLVGRDGSVINAPFLEWRRYPLRDRLIAKCDPEWIAAVCNDAFAFANAEASNLTISDAESILLVVMAEGIGGAIIDAGRPMMGAHGFSGEVGHIVITAQDRTDTFELLAGGKSFSNVLDPGLTVAEGVNFILDNLDDPRIRAALEFWSEAMASGFANTIHILDPGRIVLGGPLAPLYAHVGEAVERLLETKLLDGFEVPPIVVAKFGVDGAAIGAAATIRETIFALPELD